MDVIRPTNATQRRAALTFLVAKPHSAPEEVDQQIDSLIRYAERNGLSLEHCLLAQEHGRNVTSCLLVDSPGRTSSVFLAASSDLQPVADASVQLLEVACTMAKERGVQLLQGMVAPEFRHETAVYRRADFEHLTTLLYLENDLLTTTDVIPPAPPVTWRTYAPENRQAFADAVQATYADSLDCGGLNGRRDIEDVLASHRGTGQFDPRFWLMALSDREPVGVLLLTHIPERWSLEVAYMGLLPPWRGRGYGSALLRRGLELAREQGVMTMTLTVDVTNAPARRLYRRFSFHETSRRDAWIRLLW